MKININTYEKFKYLKKAIKEHKIRLCPIKKIERQVNLKFEMDRAYIRVKAKRNMRLALKLHNN